MRFCLTMPIWHLVIPIHPHFLFLIYSMESQKKCTFCSDPPPQSNFVSPIIMTNDNNNRVYNENHSNFMTHPNACYSSADN